MYGLPPKIDLSFFNGKELEQICIGQHQVILKFSGDVSISVESKIFYSEGEINPIIIDDYPASATLLSTLLSCSIVNAQGQLDGMLILMFSNKVILKISDDNSQFESYKITNGSIEIIV